MLNFLAGLTMTRVDAARTPFTLLLLLMFITVSGSAADRVSAEDGRIFLEDSSGHRTVLTENGFDSDPWLSPNGATVLFVRHSAEDQFRTSVFAIDLRTRTTKLLHSGPVKYQGRKSSYFGHPEFDESRDKLFLLSKEYATEGALISIHLATGRADLISDHIVGYDVITCPKKYRGDLIGLKRQEIIQGRPFFLYHLYSPAGEDLGLIAPALARRSFGMKWPKQHSASS